MVETVQLPHPPHPPAVKVGGRRLSVSNRPKPPAHPEAESPTDAKEDDDEARKKDKKPNFDKHAQRKAETNRPTRDTQNSYKAFAGNRIAQPAGKGLGI